MLRQDPETSWPWPPGQSWEAPNSPGHSPSPRPQLPSFLPARHLVLVPSKRMRRGSLPLPVIKASPAQLTPKRPPLDTAASWRGLPRPPPLCHQRLGRNTGSPGSESQAFTFTLILHPFPAPWVRAESWGQEENLQSNSLQLATEEAGWGGQR